MTTYVTITEYCSCGKHIKCHLLDSQQSNAVHLDNASCFTPLSSFQDTEEKGKQNLILQYNMIKKNTALGTI